MPTDATPATDFGTADLSNCEQEQLHLPGSIQPHGALLLLEPNNQKVLRASANTKAFLGLEFDPLGHELQAVEGDLFEKIQPRLGDRTHDVPVGFHCHVGKAGKKFDVLMHHLSSGELIVELEQAGPPIDVTGQIEDALQRILTATNLRTLCDVTAEVYKDLLGYDRVMVYRFDDEGHGEVFSEVRETHLEAFLGNRYPASDIPQIARRLYERNRVRVLYDVDYEPSPIVSASSEDFSAFDMSLCLLRSISPIHLQYLKNMGVSATLVASLMAGGRLWGLISCHHYSPRFIYYETRAVCELLAEAVGTRITALEAFTRSQAQLSVRRLEQSLIEGISHAGDWRSALFDNTQTILQPVGATGAALLYEGEVYATGEVPGTHQLRNVGKWLDLTATGEAVATASLSADNAEFDNIKDVASGIIAVPLSHKPSEYLLWFRPERIHTVTWGGNPNKPVEIGNDASSLSPRRSFAQWHQVVQGTSDPWTPADLAAADLIGTTVRDVILQFRTVRTLIAQDQLQQVSESVMLSEQPVVIADVSGAIVLVNDAFKAMPGIGEADLQTLRDLPSYFANETDFQRRLDDLIEKKRNWRGEVYPLGEKDENAMLVRGDSVFSSPERVLGFVLVFIDISREKAATAARQRFQIGLFEDRRAMNVQLAPNDNHTYNRLLSSIVENVQLAAMEVTDAEDLACMPETLEGLRTSATRTAELLENLVWHASDTQSGKD